MASVFWYAHDILLSGYLEKDKTINSDYYMAHRYKSMKTMVKLNELGFEFFLTHHILQI